ncbi:MAG: DUF4923 family protein [Muribaculaceae bacterium]|nr:DUF4923 family protein [Muribaculaceae bacterium]
MWKKVLLLLGAVMLCHALQAQELVDTIEYFDPNEVFEVSEDTVELARIEACRMVAGEWHYKKPYVHADGSSFIGKLGKPIAKSKLKKNLDKAYKKLKIKNRWNSLTLTADGDWEMRVLGLPLKGRYTYDPENESLTLKWNGIPLKSHAHRDGKKLYLAFDTDRLLMILHMLSGISSSETLKALSFLSQNFSNVEVGFEMMLK